MVLPSPKPLSSDLQVGSDGLDQHHSDRLRENLPLEDDARLNEKVCAVHRLDPQSESPVYLIDIPLIPCCFNTDLFSYQRLHVLPPVPLLTRRKADGDQDALVLPVPEGALCDAEDGRHFFGQKELIVACGHGKFPPDLILNSPRFHPFPA